MCSIPLSAGEYFTMSENYELFCQSQLTPPPIGILSDVCLSSSGSHYIEGLTPQPSAGLDDAHLQSNLTMSRMRKEESDEHEDYPDEEPQQHNRSKRMRTSFKHHQLRTMKQYFNLNHNPDAKDLKQLAQKTGLTKRVLQVWFQNARAKYRRSMQGRDAASISPTQLMPLEMIVDHHVPMLSSSLSQPPSSIQDFSASPSESIPVPGINLINPAILSAQNTPITTTPSLADL
ncbi:hypothetical protein WR25_20437 [Diploscapter pachys]|uniref:Homeobox domain-containing protein n=1 Tax=Diploscapter pachys TaxID=2018661 RepID=A0A2A2L521_9BILA|nr:hypothetical protein WR25_20437 [Diploscapter pachys]